MFLRRYRRTKDGKTHTYFALVESVRTDAGPRQHVVAHLGELNRRPGTPWQRTVVFHNRQGDAQQLRLFPDDDNVPLPDDPDIVRVRLDEVGWTNARRFGDVWLARWLWQLLGLDAIVDRHVPQGKETRPARRHRRHRSHQSPVPAVQRIRPRRALVRLHGAGRSPRRARRSRHQGPPVSHARSTCSRPRSRIENDLKERFGRSSNSTTICFCTI